MLDIVNVMTLLPKEAGENVMEFGDVGEYFYFILMGQVDVYIPIPTKIGSFKKIQKRINAKKETLTQVQT